MAVLKLKPKNVKELQAGLDLVGTGKKYSELHVSGSTTIDNQIFMNDGTRLTCDPGAIWKLMDNAPIRLFGEQDPMVTQYGKTIRDLFVDGLTIDGNYKCQGCTQNDHGLGYGNAFGFSNITNSVFQNVTVQNSEGDGFRISVGSGLQFLNNAGARYGHDFIHVYKCKNVTVSGNKVDLRTNNALRVRNCQGVTVTGNTFTGTKEAQAPAVQIELKDKGGSLQDILVKGNVIANTDGPGIWLISNQPASASKNVVINGNTITACGQMNRANKIPGVGGIVFDGVNVTVSGNVIRNCLGYAVGYEKYVAESGLSGYTAVVTGNRITGTRAANYPGTASGTAIYAKDNHYRFMASKNVLSGNVRDYYNVKPVEG